MIDLAVIATLFNALLDGVMRGLVIIACAKYIGVFDLLGARSKTYRWEDLTPEQRRAFDQAGSKAHEWADALRDAFGKLRA